MYLANMTAKSLYYTDKGIDAWLILADVSLGKVYEQFGGGIRKRRQPGFDCVQSNFHIFDQFEAIFIIFIKMDINATIKFSILQNKYTNKLRQFSSKI